MTHIPTVIALLAYITASARILFFQRGDATHKRHVSLLAWMLLVTCGASALDLLLFPHPVSFIEAAQAWALSVLVAASKGNVARMCALGD